MFWFCVICPDTPGGRTQNQQNGITSPRNFQKGQCFHYPRPQSQGSIAVLCEPPCQSSIDSIEHTGDHGSEKNTEANQKKQTHTTTIYYNIYIYTCICIQLLNAGKQHWMDHISTFIPRGAVPKALRGHTSSPDNQPPRKVPSNIANIE